MRSRGGIVGLALAVAFVPSLLGPAGDATGEATPTPRPLLSTELGSGLRVGPPGAPHAVGLLANGAGAVGIVVAADGAFLAFTCGHRPYADAWFSGDWYRGTVTGDQPTEAVGSDGETLRIARGQDGRLIGRLLSPEGDEFSIAAAPARGDDGLYRRDDADGVLGAVALPGNQVCAVKRTARGALLPAGTTSY